MSNLYIILIILGMTKKTLKKQRGGSDELLSDIIQALLEMKSIMFLPNTYIVNNEDKYNDYLSSIDSKTLLFLVKENNIGETDAIKQIFGGPVREDPPQVPDASQKIIQNLELIKPELENTKDYHYYKQFLEMNNQLEQLYSQIKLVKKDIEKYNTQISQFQCVDGLDNYENEFITNFILDCSKYSIKDVDWFRVILKLDKLDEEFEIEVNKLYNQNNINLDYNRLKPHLELLVSNEQLKDMFELRLINCSNDPYSFFGNIDFSSLDDCNQCHDDCILHLNDNYKAFLMVDIPGIDITNKLKILVFCEYRLFLFSKYVTLEAIRIKGKRYTKVINILKSLSEKQENKIFMKKATDKKKQEQLDKLSELEKKQESLSQNINQLVDDRGFKGGQATDNQTFDNSQIKQASVEQMVQQEPVQVEQMVQQEPVQPVEPVQAEPVQADPVQADPVQTDPVQQPNYVYEDLVPDCDAITKDVLDGKIKQRNFLYLSPNCNNEISNALKNSQN